MMKNEARGAGRQANILSINFVNNVYIGIRKYETTNVWLPKISTMAAYNHGGWRDARSSSTARRNSKRLKLPPIIHGQCAS